MPEMQSRVHEPVVRRADLSELQEVRHVAKRHAVQAARAPISARVWAYGSRAE